MSQSTNDDPICMCLSAILGWQWRPAHRPERPRIPVGSGGYRQLGYRLRSGALPGRLHPRHLLHAVDQQKRCVKRRQTRHKQTQQTNPTNKQTTKHTNKQNTAATTTTTAATHLFFLQLFGFVSQKKNFLIIFFSFLCLIILLLLLLFFFFVENGFLLLLLLSLCPPSPLPLSSLPQSVNIDIWSGQQVVGVGWRFDCEFRYRWLIDERTVKFAIQISTPLPFIYRWLTSISVLDLLIDC